MSNVIGYPRASTNDQDLGIQLAALKAAGCDVFPISECGVRLGLLNASRAYDALGRERPDASASRARSKARSKSDIARSLKVSRGARVLWLTASLKSELNALTFTPTAGQPNASSTTTFTSAMFAAPTL